jgi:hypothetical protein
VTRFLQLQELKFKLERLYLETQSSPQLTEKRNLIASSVLMHCSREINEEGIKLFIVLDWKNTLPEPFFELRSTCRIRAKKIQNQCIYLVIFFLFHNHSFFLFNH